MSAPSTLVSSRQKLPFGTVAIVGTVVSLLACYSKLFVVTLQWLGLAAEGGLNPHLQAGVMSVFALFATCGLYADKRSHGNAVPFWLGFTGTAVVIGTLYIHYRTEIEFSGYFLLIIAVFLNQNQQLKALHATISSMNQALNERVAEVEQATQAKSRFLASMSHELRTPLNAIIGIAEMVHEDSEADGNKALAESHRRILRSGEHLLNVVNDVLDLSKIEAGRLELQIESVPVSGLLQDVANAAESLARQGSNTFEMVCESDVGSVRTDPTRARQIVLNLIGNAMKFTDHGEVRLEVRQIDAHQNLFVAFTVADTGSGIAPEALERIFEEFTQLDTGDRRTQGTGLGLSISKRLCESMGGRISAHSQVGVGSSFTVELPVAH